MGAMLCTERDQKGHGSHAGHGKVPVYLDYNGTTPLDAEVCAVMAQVMHRDWGNPSSSHYYGLQAKRAMDAARAQTAGLVGAAPEEITFMSNGTETINVALLGLFELAQARGGTPHLVTQATEHVAVLEVCRALERRGCRVTYLPVTEEGLVRVEDLQAALCGETFLVSIMHSNNETGALQPIAELVTATKARGAHFHCDASQSLGKLRVDVDELGVDLLTIAGHKLYAPKGVGALYHRSAVPKLPPLLHGAGQEGGRRASTENVIHVAGLGKACEVAQRDLERNAARLQHTRDLLHRGLEEALGANVRLNGPKSARLPNTLNVSFRGVPANVLLEEIRDEVAASAGAACHSDVVKASHVIEAMKVPKEWAMGACRFTVGRETTDTEIAVATAAIAQAVTRRLESK